MLPLTLAFLLFVPARASEGPVPQKESVDLSSLFPDHDRNQDSIGSCHTFAAVAVLEAAYGRQYGEKKRFSEADLFFGMKGRDIGEVLTAVFSRNLDAFVVGGESRLAQTLMAGENALESREGHWVEKDLDLALRRGVLPADAKDADYVRFHDRYRALKNDPYKTLPSLKKSMEALGAPSSAVDSPLMQDALAAEDDIRRDLDGYFGLDADEQMREERAAIRKKLQGFKAKNLDLWSYNETYLRTSKPPGDDVCRAHGAKAARVLVAELDSGRPVAVSMRWIFKNASQAQAWSRHAYHALVFSGYQVHDGGRITFKVRNSWNDRAKDGGMDAGTGLADKVKDIGNDPIGDEAMCRVMALDTVLTPSDEGRTP